MTTVEADQVLDRPCRPRAPKTCTFCNLSFSKSEHLQRHIRSHTREKPFTCTICSKSYGRQDSLVRHVRSHRHARNCSATPRESVGAGGAAQQERTSLPSVTVLEESRMLDTADTLSTGFDLNGLEWQGVANSGQNRVESGFAADETSCSSSNIDLLTLGVQPFESSWLLAEDFDVRALDTSIADAITDWRRPAGSISDSYDSIVPAAAPVNHVGARFNGVSPTLNTAITIQQNWYTNITPVGTVSSATRRLSRQEAVDDEYRVSLANRLQARMSDDALPSADFLNLCIKLYFAKFHPIFPILHAPSFQPSSENALILLSICSMGALFVGSSSATSQGRNMFQRLNKANLTSWESVITRGKAEVISLTQAAIIGQTFAMCSGHSTDINLAESFHGTVIAWARRGGMFLVHETMSDPKGIEERNIESKWRVWIQAEETVRIVMALHIHDAGFASIFHHEPLLRHDPPRLPICCSEDAMFASTAERWAHTLSKGTIPERSCFQSYAALAGILASVQDVRGRSFGPTQVSDFRNRLLSWLSEQPRESLVPANDPLCVLVMWHECFLSMYADLDQLEIWVGRDGLAATGNVSKPVTQWAASPEARLCILHAFIIQECVESLPANSEPAIHVPRALFYSAIVIYTYLKARPSSDVFHPSHSDVNIPELSLSHPSIERSKRPIRFPSIDLGVVCNAADLLKRRGHLDISRRFASTLEPLLDNAIAVWN